MIPGTDSLVAPLPDVPGLGQRVHETLEKLVISGALAPGTRLVEVNLAEMLGVSRGPIRAALQQLAQDGFIELRPRQGAFVRVPTQKEIEDFYDIRRVLEGESARLAALRITPAGAERLLQCIKAAKGVLAKGQDPSDIIGNLHEIICAIADNSELARYLALHTKRSIWYKAPFEPERHKRAWEEHDAIVAAIIRGDSAAAVSAMYAHIDGARARYRTAT